MQRRWNLERWGCAGLIGESQFTMQYTHTHKHIHLFISITITRWPKSRAHFLSHTQRVLLTCSSCVSPGAHETRSEGFSQEGRRSVCMDVCKQHMRCAKSTSLHNSNHPTAQSPLLRLLPKPTQPTHTSHDYASVCVHGDEQPNRKHARIIVCKVKSNYIRYARPISLHIERRTVDNDDNDDDGQHPMRTNIP